MENLEPKNDSQEQTRDHEDEVTCFMCGPSRPTCKCECGNGGPCEHDFQGMVQDGPCFTAVCTKCGMTAIAHDMWVCP